MYTITSNAELITITGVTGTVHANKSYALMKVNVNKIVKDIPGASVGIIMLNNDAYTFGYTELIDPTTSLAFASLDLAVDFISGSVGTAGSSYPNELFSSKITLTQNVATIVKPGAGAGWITIKADSGNGSAVIIGPSTVTTTNGFSLAQSEAVSMEHDPLSEIYAISAGVSQVIYIIGSARSLVVTTTAAPTTTLAPTTTVAPTTTLAPTTTVAPTTTL